MVMRDVKHVTTGHAEGTQNVAPIWSHDGKYIVYTQEQAKGTDSNIFICRSGDAAEHTAHSARGRADATLRMTSRPTARAVLITSNARQWVRKCRLARNRDQEDHWLTQDKWEIAGEEHFSPDGKSLTYTANVDGNDDVYLYDVAPGKARGTALAEGT